MFSFCYCCLEENGNISVVAPQYGGGGGGSSRGTRHIGYYASNRALYASSNNNAKREPLGSGPPNCLGSCGACKPCSAVHVPVRARHAPMAMGMGDINDNDTRQGRCRNYGNRLDHMHGRRRRRGRRHRRASNGLMEYYPERWKCKCKNKVYMPPTTST